MFEQQSVNLGPLWSELSKPRQLDIRIAQNRLVEAAPAFLRQVGAHRTSEVRQVLIKWDEADHRRAEAERSADPFGMM